LFDFHITYSLFTTIVVWRHLWMVQECQNKVLVLAQSLLKGHKFLMVLIYPGCQKTIQSLFQICSLLQGLIVIPRIHMFFQFKTIKDKFCEPDGPSVLVHLFQIRQFSEQVSSTKLMCLHLGLKVTSPAIMHQHSICKTCGEAIFDGSVSTIICTSQPGEPSILPCPYPDFLTVELRSVCHTPYAFGRIYLA